MNQELYKKVLPALKTKVSDLRSFGISEIDEKDVWKYLVNEVWDEKERTINEIVNDILNCPNYLIKDYLFKKINKTVNKDDNLL